MSLSYHVHSWNNEVMATLLRARPKSLKILPSNIEPIRQWADECQPDTLVLRKYVGHDEEQSHFIDRGQAGAKDLADQIANEYAAIIAFCQARGIRLYTEGVNEPSRRFMWEDIAKFNQYGVWFARYAKANGMLPLFGSLATGNLPGKGWKGAANPDDRGPYDTFLESLAAHWAYLLDAVRECHRVGGGVTSNGYGGDSMVAEPWRTWHVLRYRLDRQALSSLDPNLANVLWFRGETGIDAQLVGRPIQDAGWEKMLGEDEYARQLDITGQEFTRDGVTGFIFDLGALPPFQETFEVAGVWPVADVIAHQQEAPTMPLTETKGVYHGPQEMRAGSIVTLDFTLSGVDDGFFILDVNLPRGAGPGDPAVANDPKVVGALGPNLPLPEGGKYRLLNGRNSLPVTIPPFWGAANTNGNIRLWCVEAIADGHVDPEDGSLSAPINVAVTIYGNDVAGPGPEQPAPVQPGPLLDEYNPLFALAGDLVNKGNQQDKIVGARIQDLVKWRKGEIPDPWMARR